MKMSVKCSQLICPACKDTIENSDSVRRCRKNHLSIHEECLALITTCPLLGCDEKLIKLLELSMLKYLNFIYNRWGSKVPINYKYMGPSTFASRWFGSSREKVQHEGWVWLSKKTSWSPFGRKEEHWVITLATHRNSHDYNKKPMLTVEVKNNGEIEMISRNGLSMSATSPMRRLAWNDIKRNVKIAYDWCSKESVY